MNEPSPRNEAADRVIEELVWRESVWVDAADGLVRFPWIFLQYQHEIVTIFRECRQLADMDFGVMQLRRLSGLGVGRLEDIVRFGHRHGMTDWVWEDWVATRNAEFGVKRRERRHRQLVARKARLTEQAEAAIRQIMDIERELVAFTSVYDSQTK